VECPGVDDSQNRKRRQVEACACGAGVTAPRQPRQTRAPRQPRQTREELRARLLHAGRAILLEQGLSSGAEAVTFKTVFDRVQEESGIRVTNGSVIGRVWANQAEFRTDVLVTVAHDDHHEQIEFGLEAVRAILDDADLHSPASRLEAMRELCRLVGEINSQVVRKSSSWPLWIGVWALAASGQPLDDRKRIESALVDGFDAFTERIVEAYVAMAGFLGFRPRQPLTIRQFAVAADSLGQGYGLRNRIDDSVTEYIDLPSGPDGATQKWTLFAVAFDGLVQRFFELDPDWER
jgi:hypothetical protein